MRSQKAIEKKTKLSLLEWVDYYVTNSRDQKRKLIRCVTNHCANGTISILNCGHILGDTE